MTHRGPFQPLLFCDSVIPIHWIARSSFPPSRRSSGRSIPWHFTSKPGATRLPRPAGSCEMDAGATSASPAAGPRFADAGPFLPTGTLQQPGPSPQWLPGGRALPSGVETNL